MSMCINVYSGIEYSHEEFGNCFMGKHADFVNEDEGGRDYHGHGTHVAGE